MRPMYSLLFIPALCLAQEAAQKPTLTFDKVHHDFGRVSADKKVAFRFKATNSGQGPLQIKQVIPSCGCTYTVMGQWYLKPGESTELEATFDPKGMRGAVRKSLRVLSDDPVSPDITLSFEAFVIQDIMPSTQAIFFDQVPRGSAPKKATIRLESGNGQPVQVTDVKAPGSPYLTSTVRQEGKDAVIDIFFDPSKAPKDRLGWTDLVSVRTTNERMNAIPINVQWELRSAVRATPRLVAWVEPVGQERRSVVQLKQADGKPFKVLSAKSSNPMIRVEGISKTAAAEQQVTLILAADAKPGRYAERVTLTLDDAEQPELEIRVSAALQ